MEIIKKNKNIRNAETTQTARTAQKPRNIIQKRVTYITENGCVTDRLHSDSFACITEGTTIRELADMLPQAHGKTPTHKFLRENFNVVAKSQNCAVYENGWAFFSCESGRVVVSVEKCCGSFCYDFNPGDKGNEMMDGAVIPASEVEKLPWGIAIAMHGEEWADRHSMNRQGDRNRVYGMTNDNGEVLDIWEIIPDDRHASLEDSIVSGMEKDRLTALAFGGLTEKQVCVMERYMAGMTHQEIADEDGVVRRTVTTTIERSRKKMQKLLQGEELD